MAELTLTFPPGTTATIVKTGQQWFVTAISFTDVSLTVDDANDNGTISDAEWDASIGGGGNDTGSTFYLYQGTGSDGTLYATDGTATFTIGQNVTAIVNGLSNSFEADVSGVICFTRGTLIRTPDGDRRIEDLRAGDLVDTLDNGPMPIRWIMGRECRASGNFAPILIREGALGNSRDLRVSPHHRMLVGGWRAQLMFGEAEILVPAKALIDNVRILRDEGGTVEYFHILFSTHQIVFAEGIPSESFHPGQQGWCAIERAARDEILKIFPELQRKGFGAYGPSARAGLTVREGTMLASLG